MIKIENIQGIIRPRPVQPSTPIPDPPKGCPLPSNGNGGIVPPWLQ